MATVIRSGFLAAVVAVQAFLTDNSVNARVEVGWRRRNQQLNQGPGGANRVVFTPSADDSGAGGSLIPPRFVGPRTVYDKDPLAVDPTRPVATMRALRDWQRRALVSVWAVDVTRREDEAAQIEAVETLFEWVMRAVHGSPGAFAAVTWGDVTWTPPGERAFGLELRAGLTFTHPVFDSPRDIAYPAGAAVARGTYSTDDGAITGGDT